MVRKFPTDVWLIVEILGFVYIRSGLFITHGIENSILNFMPVLFT